MVLPCTLANILVHPAGFHAPTKSVSAEVEEARISLGGRVTVYGLLEWRHEIQHGKGSEVPHNSNG